MRNATNMCRGRGTRTAVVAPRPFSFQQPQTVLPLIQQACLQHPEILPAKWRPIADSLPLHGFCYAASEALYFFCGGKASGYKPMQLTHEGASHWWLVDQDGIPWDVTASQFRTPVPYEQGTGRGFLTGDKPSKAAQVLIDDVRQQLQHSK